MNKILERHVQAIWYDPALRPKNLFSRKGQEVKVIDPGVWNVGGGPDFRDAVIEVGRTHRLLKGDVEVHLCPSDWNFHHHGCDANYRNVIAHVTWNSGPIPETLPSEAISIWIGRFVMSDPMFDMRQIDLAAYPYAKLPHGSCPCEDMIGENPVEAYEILKSAGHHRFRMKARNLLGRLCEKSKCYQQVFYEEVMNALGYSRNSLAFRNVAERVPIAALGGDSQILASAFLTAGTFEEWEYNQIRPHNSPRQRLKNAAKLFLDTPLLELAVAKNFSEASCRKLIKAMMMGGSVGKGRAAAILVNVILPLAIADGRVKQLPEWLPPEDVSRPVRMVARRMFGRDHNPARWYANNGVLIQGLIEIGRRYCERDYPRCSSLSSAEVCG